jgi:rhamnosyltransferase
MPEQLQTDYGPGAVGVVVVTYHPTGDYARRLQQMAAQGAVMVVVDNGSTPEKRDALARLCREQRWVFIPNATNLGIAAALNQGMREVEAHGLGWALSFDQDSEPAAGFSEALLTSCGQQPRPAAIAMVGVSHSDLSTGVRQRILRPNPRCRLFFQKVSVAETDLASVTMVITSGCLTRVTAWRQLGGFDEALFIDFVDTDFCLRARAAGWLIVVSARAQLAHALGERAFRRFLGVQFHPTNHNALRRYYIARNRLRLVVRHGWRAPHWLLFELCATGLNLVRIVTVEAGRRRKLLGEAWGTCHGLVGRCGPAPSVVIERLTR